MKHILSIVMISMLFLGACAQADANLAGEARKSPPGGEEKGGPGNVDTEAPLAFQEPYEYTFEGLQLRQTVGEVKELLTEDDLGGLRSFEISTKHGTTKATQTLSFGGTFVNRLEDVGVNYVKNEDDVMDDYFVVETDKPFFEWNLNFGEGLVGELKNGVIEDFAGRRIAVMGDVFRIFRAESSGQDIEITFFTDSAVGVLEEGTTGHFTVDGTTYEVTLVQLTDTGAAQFSVNGELTQPLQIGEIDTLSFGIMIGLSGINRKKASASFMMGTSTVEMYDPTLEGTYDGSVEIANENINDAQLSIVGEFITSKGKTAVSLNNIWYALFMDPDLGSEAYVPPQGTVREYMKRPQSMLSDKFDIAHNTPGIVYENPGFSIEAFGDDEYSISFKNNQGKTYNTPFITMTASGLYFGDGDGDQFVIRETSPTGGPEIIYDDAYILLSSVGETSSIVQYVDFNLVEPLLEFEDVSTGSLLSVPLSNATGTLTGNLVIAGYTHLVEVYYISPEEVWITVDLDADGAFNTSIVDLFTNKYRIEILPNPKSSVLGFYGQEEEFIVQVGGNISTQEIDLSFSETSYEGPRAGQGLLYEFQCDEPDDDMDDWEYCRTDYGTRIREYDPSNATIPNEFFLDIPGTQFKPEVSVVMG